MKNYPIKTLAIFVTIFYAAFFDICAASPKHEMRSVWLATVYNIDWPKETKAVTGTTPEIRERQKAQMISMLDGFAESGLNAVCFQVRSMCDAMYKSKYEPWSEFVSGERGADPGWDPLQFVVEECHKRGLECHAWINPYRFSTGQARNTPQDNMIEARGMLLRHEYTDSKGKLHKYVVLDPGNPETRQHICDVSRDIMTNYAVDGLLCDDYFYPNGIPEDETAGDYKAWKASGTALSFGDWRRENVNQMIRELYETVKSVRLDARFGMAPAGGAGSATTSARKYGVIPAPFGDWQYTSIFSDPLAWLEDKSIDYMSAQIYSRIGAPRNEYTAMVNWWNYVCKKYDADFYTSQSISELGNANTVENYAEYKNQIKVSRKYSFNNAPGSILFSAQYISGPKCSGFDRYLKKYVFNTRALMPLNRKRAGSYRQYGKVTGLQKVGNTLKWDAFKDGERIIKYAVYAVPVYADLQNSQTESGGLSQKYLLGVSYTNSFDISACNSGYWYGVAIYDGFGKEHELTVLNAPNPYPAGEKPQLKTPANGETVSADFRFEWSDVKAVEYTLEIAEDADFNEVVFSKETPDNYCDFKFSDLYEIPYFWRVRAVIPYKSNTVSETGTFEAAEAGSSPEAGYSIIKDEGIYAPCGELKIENLWMRSVRSDFDNFGNFAAGKNFRGFAADKDYCYIASRNESGTVIWLSRLDVMTGEQVKDVNIHGGGIGGYMPCNDIVKDSRGNLLFVNLTTDMSRYPLQLYGVDRRKGTAGFKAIYYGDKKERVDHALVVGDSESGRFNLLAAQSNGGTLFNWDIENGEIKDLKKLAVSKFCPSSASHFGSAPSIKPFDDNCVTIDGAGTFPAVYDINTGKMTASFDDIRISSDKNRLQPKARGINGSEVFAVGGVRYIAYPVNDNSGAGISWKVAKLSGDNFEGMKSVWDIPAGGIGKVYSGTMQADAEYVSLSENEGLLFLYAPSNGIAAYKISIDNAGTNDAARNEFSVVQRGNRLKFSCQADKAEIYSISGMCISFAENCTETECCGESGIYILKAECDGKTMVKKIVLTENR